MSIIQEERLQRKVFFSCKFIAVVEQKQMQIWVLLLSWVVDMLNICKLHEPLFWCVCIWMVAPSWCIFNFLDKSFILTEGKTFSDQSLVMDLFLLVLQKKVFMEQSWTNQQRAAAAKVRDI